MPALPANVGVVFGGPSPEHDVSILTGLQATHALAHSSAISRCHGLYWTKTGAWYEVPVDTEAEAFSDGPPKGASEVTLEIGPNGGFRPRGRFSRSGERLDIDAVVLCCHGGPGEDGTLQGALDLAGIAYSGPSAIGAALGMDKLATVALLESADLPVLPRILLERTTPRPQFEGPYIVKPRRGGSSIGIEVVADIDTARARIDANVHLRHGAVLEPYRPDLFDLQVAVRSWPEYQLSEIERPLRTGTNTAILDYRSKYVGSEGMASAPRELPAEIPDDLAEKLREFALRAARVFLVRGVARIDFLSDGTALYVNELNTIPGSLSRHLFVKPVVEFGELLGDLLDEAVQQPAASFSAAGADGALLRSAASISSKLG